MASGFVAGRGVRTALLLAVCFVNVASGSLGVLGRVEDSEGELRHTVGVVGRADATYQKAEGVRTQVKEVENSALHMERVLEQRLAGLMAEEKSQTARSQSTTGSQAVVRRAATRQAAVARVPPPVVAAEPQASEVKPSSAAAARKAAVVAAKRRSMQTKHAQALHTMSKQRKAQGGKSSAAPTWFKQWLWPFA